MQQLHTHDLRILDNILKNGLCAGKGNGKTTFCAEQAVSVLCGLPLTDHPDECVAPAVSAFGRRLNDSHGWGSGAVRASGMRNFLIAQIGSKGVVDGKEFSSLLVLKTINRVLPLWLRHGNIKEDLVVACEQAGDLDAAKRAALMAKSSASASAYASASAAESASAYASASASAYASASASASAAESASASASESASASAYASESAVRLKALHLSAKIAVEVLQELGSPGCKLLKIRL